MKKRDLFLQTAIKTGNVVKIETLRETGIVDVERYEYDILSRMTKQIRLTDEQDILNAGGRKKLNLKDGDKVIFIEENGRVVMENSTKVALREVQNAFVGEAERLGLETEGDVANLVKQVRKEMWEERHANND